MNRCDVSQYVWKCLTKQSAGPLPWDEIKFDIRWVNPAAWVKQLAGVKYDGLELVGLISI